MNHKFTGKGIIIADNADFEYHLITIDKQINDNLHTLLHAKHDTVIKQIETNYGIHPKYILAYGKGSPSKNLLSKFITPIGSYFDKEKGMIKSYPCYCHQETDCKIRWHERMSPVLHDNIESSFNCARERLMYPEYCIIIKIEKNGKEIVKTNTTSTKEV